MIDFSHLKHSAEDYRDRPSEAGFEELAAAASDDDCGVLALFAELERIKAENEALRKALGKISVQVDENIRCAVSDVVNCRGDVQDIYGYCDNIDEIIEAAMAKEANHG